MQKGHAARCAPSLSDRASSTNQLNIFCTSVFLYGFIMLPSILHRRSIIGSKSQTLAVLHFCVSTTNPLLPRYFRYFSNSLPLYTLHFTFSNPILLTFNLFPILGTIFVPFNLKPYPPWSSNSKTTS